MSKKNIFFIIILAVIIAGVLFFIFRKSPVIKNYPPKGATVVAFGDSLTEGVGSTAGNDYPSVLSRLIGEPIINMGVSGNTSAQGLARIEDVISKDPKIVLVLFGGNDFLRRISTEETFKNIDSMVVQLQNSGALVVLLGVKGGIVLDGYEDYFEDIAKNRGALYVPNVLSGFFGKKEYMSDGIHPNDAGYRKIAEKVYSAMKDVLK